jgi:peptidoglycan/xylan/chitin deacetylase (PgdA/CDA1 family)
MLVDSRGPHNTTRGMRAIRWMVGAIHRSLSPRTLPPRIAILLHHVPPSQAHRLRNLLATLLEHGYEPGSPGDYLRDSTRRMLVTFDDCFASWLDVLPILDELGISGTFYVNTAPLRDVADAETLRAYRIRIGDHEGLPTLSTSEVRAIAEAGHTIGCHGHEHLDLGAVDPDRAIRDVAVGRRRLAEAIGRAVHDFAYPYGQRRHLPDAVAARIRGMGFRSIAHGTPGQLWREPERGEIERTYWRPEDPADHDLANLRVRGEMFRRATGRSPVP